MIEGKVLTSDGEVKDVRNAIELLKIHQQWRLGKIDEMPYKPRQITQALDILIQAAEQHYRCNYCEKDIDTPIILCKECTE